MSNILVLTKEEELKKAINKMIEGEYQSIRKNVLNLNNLSLATKYQLAYRFADIVIIDIKDFDIEKCHRLKVLTPHILLIYIVDDPENYNLSNAEPFKVVTMSELQEAIHEAIYRINRSSPRYFIYNKSKDIIKVDTRKILYFWSDKSKRYYRLENGFTDYFYENMDELEKRLSRYGFVRISKSYIINPKYILDVNNKYEVQMSNGIWLKRSGKWKQSYL